MKLVNPLGRIPAAGDITPLDGCACSSGWEYTKDSGTGCNCQCDHGLINRNANRDWAISA